MFNVKETLDVEGIAPPEVYQRANELQGRGDGAGAEKLLEATLNDFPRDLTLIETLGQVQTAIGAYERAWASFERALSIDPGRASPHLSMACVLSALGRRQEALAHYEWVLSTDPNHLGALVAITQVLAAEGRLDAASAFIARAQAIAPEDPVVLASVASIEQARGRLDSALDAWRRLSRLQEPTVEVAKSIGQLLWQKAEAKRNSSIFKDVEDGLRKWEDVAAGLERSKVLARYFPWGGERWRLLAQIDALTRQIAGQHAALGRLDAVYTVNEYMLLQGRMRNMALHCYRGNNIAVPVAPLTMVPPELVGGFSMGSRVPIIEGYCDSSLPSGCSEILDDDLIKGFLWHNLKHTRFRDRERVAALLAGYQPIDHTQARRALGRTGGQHISLSARVAALAQRVRSSGFAFRNLVGQSVAVVGEPDLYVESMLLARGANVTSVRRTAVESRCSLIEVLPLTSWLDKADRHDFVLCRWMVENAGLGRYGDALEPDGDLVLLDALRRKLYERGRLVVTLPIGRDRVIFNTLRVYGELRLPKLLAGWHVVGRKPAARALEGRVPQRVELSLIQA
jgi:tetratricopeptide (TPR) repeat protein